jgi:hypothetical protein
MPSFHLFYLVSSIVGISPFWMASSQDKEKSSDGWIMVPGKMKRNTADDKHCMHGEGNNSKLAVESQLAFTKGNMKEV